MINNEIGYAGKVTVTAVHGKKKIKSATFHNKGTIYLFKFLCYCLAGEFSAAYNMRPQKIQLFYNHSNATNPDETLSNLEERSAKIQSNTDAVVKDETISNNAKYSVTLHFRIPFAFLTGTNINHAVLFDAYDNECAHFSFTKTDPETETKVWDNLTDGLNQDYTLVIEWKMIIDNQNEGA